MSDSAQQSLESFVVGNVDLERLEAGGGAPGAAPGTGAAGAGVYARGVIG